MNQLFDSSGSSILIKRDRHILQVTDKWLSLKNVPIQYEGASFAPLPQATPAALTLRSRITCSRDPNPTCSVGHLISSWGGEA